MPSEGESSGRGDSDWQILSDLMDEASRLAELGRVAEEVAVYDQIAQQFEGAPISFQQVVGTALWRKAVALQGSHSTDEAIATCDEIVRRFGQDPGFGGLVLDAKQLGYALQTVKVITTSFEG